MTYVDDFFSMRRSAQQMAVVNIETNPDDAARAMQLGELTGTPPAVVNGDLSTFERETRANLASEIIRNNPYLSNYINNNPLASQVSNDDYGTLDVISQKLISFSPLHFTDPAFTKRLGTAIQHGFGEQPLGAWATNRPEDVAFTQKLLGTPILGDALNFLMSAPGVSSTFANPTLAPKAIEAFFRSFGAVLHGANEVMAHAGTPYVGRDTSERIARDLTGMLEYYMTMPTHFTGQRGTNRPLRDQINAVMHDSRPYIEAGIEPPPRINPQLDQLKALQAEVELDMLKELQREAQQSATRERSPEMFTEFVRLQQPGDIYIPFDAVAKLYGEKTPQMGDNLLGWVPNMSQQWNVAMATGGDIRIPMAEWLARVDPQIANELHENVRVRKGGFTLEEGKLLKEEQRLDIEFETNRIAQIEKTIQEEVVLADTAKRDGNMQLAAHIEDRIRIAKERIVKAQARIVEIKEGTKSFAEAELTDRNSQAVEAVRKQAGLDRSGETRHYGADIEAIVPDKLTSAESTLWAAFDNTLGKYIPGFIETQAATSLKSQGETVRGTFISYSDRLPIILFALQGKDIIGTARHEAIHALRSLGFFTEQEWATLRRAALEEGWFNKERTGQGSSVLSRYAHLFDEGEEARLKDLGLRRDRGEEYQQLKKKQDEAMDRFLEEAVADEFKYWNHTAENPTIAHKVFQKLREFLERLKEVFIELRTKNPDVAQIFEAIESGEIGGRKPTGVTKEMTALEREPKQLELDVTRQQDKAIFEQASAMGLTVAQYKLYIDGMKKLNAEDMAAQRERAQRLEKKSQTAEWKEESAAMVSEVTADLLDRPDIAAQAFFRYGQLYGEKMESRPRINPEFLTDAQKKALPEQWLSEHGMHPDDAAAMFGYQSGVEMILRVSEFERARGNVRPGEFFGNLVKAEVERRMVAKYGELDANILSAAEDHVLGQTQIDMLHELVLARAAQANAEFSFTREQMKQWARDSINTLMARSVDVGEWLNAAGRADAKIKAALLKGDLTTAFKEQQNQFLSTLMAREAKVFEKEMERFGRVADRFSSPVVKGIDQDYTNAIRWLLGSADFPIENGLAHVRDEMAANGFRSLESFVEASTKDGWDPAVPDVLMSQVKNHANMDVAEMRDFITAVNSLREIGKKVNEYIVNGEKADRAVFTKAVVDQLSTLPERSREKQDNFFYQWDAQLTRMEEIILDMGLRDPNSPLYQEVMAPMFVAKAKEFDMLTALSKHFNETKTRLGRKWIKSLQETIPNDFIIDPYTKLPYAMNREMMLNLMLNWGNLSNIEKLSRGYASLELGRIAGKEEGIAFAAKIKALIDQHATKTDWDFVSSMWRPFKDWESDLNTLSRNTSGVAPVLIKPEPVSTPFGMIDGGYWPVKYDKLGSKLELSKSADIDGLFGESYFRASTPKSHLKDRTGYVDFVDVVKSIEQAAGTMQQTIHDIAFRDAVIQANRVFSNNEIMAAMRKHYGKEYTDQFQPWLKRVAQRFPNDPSVEGANRTLSRMRLNLIAHTMPFNFKLWLSPDIGVPHPVKWAQFMANYGENYKLAMEHSQEIRHLIYNYDRDYRFHVESLTGRDGFGEKYQRAVIEAGFKPIMFLSQQFRMMTFMDFFRAEKANGKTDAEAARVGDYHVRERHSAASVVDLPAIAAKDEAWKLMTLFYGFQSSMYNWQRQLPGNIRRGEFSKAASTITGALLVSSLFGMWLYNNRKEGESWFKFIAKSLAIQPLSTIPMVREVATLFFEGYDARTPVGSAASAFRSLAYDAVRAQQGKRMNAPIKNTANVIGLSAGLPLSQAGRTGQWVHDINRGKQQKPRDFIEWQRGIIQGQTRLKRDR